MSRTLNRNGCILGNQTTYVANNCLVPPRVHYISREGECQMAYNILKRTASSSDLTLRGDYCSQKPTMLNFINPCTYLAFISVDKVIELLSSPINTLVIPARVLIKYGSIR